MTQNFSVVLYVWPKDFPAWVKQALASIFSNTVKPTEVIVMVDGPVSKDIQAVIDEASKNDAIRVLSHPVPMLRAAILDAGNYKDFPNLEDEYLWARVIGKGYKTANLTSVIANIHSIDAYEQMVLALPHFQMKRELFSTMRQMGMIGGFTYYRLVCTAFIKYLILPNWFRRAFHLYDVQA